MITQMEYEELKKQKKEFFENNEINLGPHPLKWSKDIKSLETHDTFILDFCRNSIKMSKYSYNKRYRGCIILLRYCSDKPHTNPPEVGGQHFKEAHLHIYKEGFEDRIAVDPNEIGIEKEHTMQDVLLKILEYFNVGNIPLIQNDLF